jgi:hypothetical protein
MPSKQLQGQLQLEHSADIDNYIIHKHNNNNNNNNNNNKFTPQLIVVLFLQVLKDRYCGIKVLIILQYICGPKHLDACADK